MAVKRVYIIERSTPLNLLSARLFSGRDLAPMGIGAREDIMEKEMNVRFNGPIPIELPPLAKPVKQFLECETDADIETVVQNYPATFGGIVERSILGLIGKEYEVCFPKIKNSQLEMKIASICNDNYDTGADLHFAMSTAQHNDWYAYEPSSPFVYSPGKDGSAKRDIGITTRREFVYLRSKDGGKIVAEFYNNWLTYEVILRVYADRSNLGGAVLFVRRIEEAISDIKGMLFNGTGQIFELGKNYAWEDAFLGDGVTEILRHNISFFLENRAFFQEHGIPCKRGILFHGPPGNGKTLAGKILACQSGINFIWATSKHIFWLEHNCRSDAFAAVYELARRISPCIVFLEDIDLLVGEERTDSKARLGAFLNELDGFENNKHVITIATTNFPEVLDKAISERPGRFDVKVRFDNPDHATRLGILKMYGKSLEFEQDADLEEIADAANGLSCAAVREVVTRAFIKASERVFRDKTGGKIAILREDLLGSVSFLSNGKVKMGFEADKTVASVPPSKIGGQAQ